MNDTPAPLRFLLTCESHPEQYDVFDGTRRVGYLRLKRGWLSICAPDHRGRELASMNVGTGHASEFADEGERFRHLSFAAWAIRQWMQDPEWETPEGLPAQDFVVERSAEL